MADLMDELEPRKTDSKGSVIESGIILDPWDGIIMPSNYSTIADIRYLLDNGNSDIIGDANIVIKYLYIFNSRVKFLKGCKLDDTCIYLLVLPEVKVVIDIFHYRKEDFIGECQYGKSEDYIESILDTIKQTKDGNSPSLSEYSFFSVKEVLEKIEKYKTNLLEVGYISYEIDYKDDSIYEREYWRSIMSTLFHGKHNWTSELSYLHIANDLDYSLLPFQVICYEDSSYITIEDGYCIERKEPLDCNWDTKNQCIDSEIAILSVEKSNSANNKLIFHGIFGLDKEKSIQKGYVSFKYIKGSLEV